MPVALMISVATDFPTYVNVPLPTVKKVVDEYVPAEDSVKPWQETDTEPILEVDPVKFICLNEPVNVGTDAPAVVFMFNRLEVVAPAVPPKLNVLVTDITALMFEVPVNVKNRAVAIDRTVVAGVVAVRKINPVVPNNIERVLELSEEKMPVFKVKLFKSKVPLVNVAVLVTSVVNESCKVTEPLGESIAIG